jgi:hypothetical protein
LPRAANSKFAAKAVIKGELLARSNPRRPLDQLITQFTRDGYYSPEAPKVEGNNFTLIVNVERRAPAEYKYVLKDLPPAPAAAEEDEGGKAGKGKSKGKGKGKGKAKPQDDDE